MTPLTPHKTRTFIHLLFVFLAVLFGGVVGLVSGVVVGVYSLFYSVFSFPVDAVKICIGNVDEGFWGPNEEDEEVKNDHPVVAEKEADCERKSAK